MKKLHLTLSKSLIGRTQRQKFCIQGLGLTKRIGSKRIINDTPENRGMIKKVHMLVDVKENLSSDSQINS